MQCPLIRCCMSSKFLFLGVGYLGLVLGVLSAVGPKRSMKLYQWIMERFNWRVVPIDESREVRTTRILGIFLTLLSLAMIGIVYLRF